jgi:hypothetical protein
MNTFFVVVIVAGMLLLGLQFAAAAFRYLDRAAETPA